jgi:ribosomal protein S18 acetylase RimI-like enzyme
LSRSTVLDRYEHGFPPSVKDPNSNERKANFIIERFDWQNAEDFDEVSSLCIDVFFQEKAELGRNPPPMRNSYSQAARNAIKDFFLSFSLQHLKDLQQKDLSMRKQNLSKDERNEMLIARQVFPCSTYEGKKARKGKDFIVSSETRIYNGIDQKLGRDNKYILGDIVGFVEVTSKAFALGEGADFTDTGRVKQRPVLSNLCVRKDLRGSGVGSSLLEACENAVTTWNPSYDEVSTPSPLYVTEMIDWTFNNSFLFHHLLVCQGHIAR